MPRSTSAAVEAAKSRAQRLSARLKELGVSVRHTQSLEALAAVEGFRDWNRYQAHLEKKCAPWLPTQGRRVLMLGPPGTGKTSACKVWAFSEPAVRVLWVEGVGDTMTYACLSEKIRSNMTKVEVRFREDGTLVSALPSPESHSWWVTIAPEFTVPSLYSEKGQDAYHEAMRALLQELKKTVSEWDRVVIEECKHRSAALEHFLAAASRMPWLPHADLVVNAQNWSVDHMPGWLLPRFSTLGETLSDSMINRLSFVDGEHVAPTSSPYPLAAFLQALNVGYREIP